MILRPVPLMLVAAFILFPAAFAMAGAAASPGAGYTGKTFHMATYTDYYALEKTDDGGLIVGGVGYRHNASSALLMRLNTGREVVWSLWFEGDSVAGISPCPAGGYYAGIYMTSFSFSTGAGMENPTGNSTIMRIDPDGNVVWKHTIPDARISAVRTGPGGDALVTGWIWGEGTDTTAFLSRFDPGGNEIWTRSICPGAAHDLVVDAGGNCTIAGANSPLEGGETGGWVIRTDPDGNVIRKTDYPEGSVFTVVPVAGGDLLVGGSTAPYHTFAGQAWVARQDPEGERRWSEVIKGVAVYDGIALDGRFVFAGKWGDFPQIQILDGSGNVLDQTIFRDRDGRLNVVIPDDNGGFTTAGWCRNLSRVEGWLVEMGADAIPEPTTPPVTSTPRTPVPTTPATPGFTVWAAGIAAAGVAVLIRRRR
ncbi:MAG: SMP-30/gluconolactonase/LRE family protein [Methanoculleaceae archaeon]